MKNISFHLKKPQLYIKKFVWFIIKKIIEMNSTVMVIRIVIFSLVGLAALFVIISTAGNYWIGGSNTEQSGTTSFRSGLWESCTKTCIKRICVKYCKIISSESSMYIVLNIFFSMLNICQHLGLSWFNLIFIFVVFVVCCTSVLIFVFNLGTSQQYITIYYNI